MILVYIACLKINDIELALYTASHHISVQLALTAEGYDGQMQQSLSVLDASKKILKDLILPSVYSKEIIKSTN